MGNSARYWRINHLSVGSTLGEQGQTSGANINFAELYFYAQSTDATPISGAYDLSQSRTGWNNSASNLTDGDSSTTVWNGDSGNGINIVFDAGTPTTIGKVRVSSVNSNYFYETPVRWVLEASQDGTTWVDTGVLTVETTAWTQAETRDYIVSPNWLDSLQVSGVRSYVVSEASAGESIVTAGVRAYVVSEASAGESIVAAGVRAYVVSQEPYPGGLGQGTAGERPEFIQSTTNYIKFEPETNNKKLLFWPDTAGDHTIIALRPNLLDFYEATQTFTLGSWQQVRIPHFNQLFITSSTLTTEEVEGIKSGMLSRATGTGIDILFFASTDTYPLTIVNPGAETGDTTGWTTSGGFTVRSDASGTTPGPYEGTYFFFGGLSTSASNAYQDIDLSTYSSGIDAGNASVSVDWYQSSNSGSDRGNIELEFYDGSSTLVGSDAGPGLTAPLGWTARTTGDVAVPTGTRTVRIIMDAVRSAGTQNNADFDALTANLTVGTPSDNSVSGGLKDPLLS